MSFDEQPKVRYDLVPPHQLEEIARVLTHGAEKYSDTNYLNVPVQDHIAAAFRHIQEWRMGEVYDGETGANALIHAACRLLFIAEIERIANTVSLNGPAWEERVKDLQDNCVEVLLCDLVAFAEERGLIERAEQKPESD